MTFSFNKKENKKENKKNIGVVYDVVMQPDIFNDDQIIEVTKFGDSLKRETAQVGLGSDGETNGHARRCDVAWFTPENCPEDLANYINGTIKQINEKYYGFELTGAEPFQYTIYEDTNLGEYKWHIDTMMIDENVRKVSVSILLSDPSEFEGGKLLVNLHGNTIVAEERKGRGVFFPSWMPHCVTPVTKGTRKSLVIWAHGPKFK